KQVAGAIDPHLPESPAWVLPVYADGVARSRGEALTQVFTGPGRHFTDGLGMVLVAALFALVSALALGALFNLSEWQELAKITVVGCAAVLIPSRYWPGPVEESWPRRLTYMALGLVMGLAALWFDGYQIGLPWEGAANVDSLSPYSAVERNHPFYNML